MHLQALQLQFIKDPCQSLGQQDLSRSVQFFAERSHSPIKPLSMSRCIRALEDAVHISPRTFRTPSCSVRDHMRVSVAIPTYNSERTIQATIESVLRQTRPADEVLIVDDGSTDRTLSLLDSYKDRLKIFREEHRGVASARNMLVDRSRGDFIAFLDSDDIWHPRYLEVQSAGYHLQPNAVAFFTGHTDFVGDGPFEWENPGAPESLGNEVLTSLGFFQQYNHAAARFASLSYCCIPKKALTQLGERPFNAGGAEDTYLLYSLILFGPVVFQDVPLVAYRMTSGSLSANRLRVTKALVRAFELLADRYRQHGSHELHGAFKRAFASKRRECAKILMGAGEAPEARRMLRRSLLDTSSPVSAMKSSTLLLLTYAPKAAQPVWPSQNRS